jgi:hypothetical protein
MTNLITRNSTITREFAEACTAYWNQMNSDNFTEILENLTEKYKVSFKKLEEYEIKDLIKEIEEINLSSDDYDFKTLSSFRDILKLLLA